MRVMLKFTLPVEKGNEAFKDGGLAKTLESIMTNLKPEAAYFCVVGRQTRRDDIFQSLEAVADRRSR